MKVVKKRKKLIIALIILVIVIAVLVWFAKKKLSEVSDAVNTIEIEKVEKRDLSEFISLNGSVSGESNRNYSSRAAAEAETIHVAVGDEVHPGDVLLTLKKDSIQSQIDIIEKSLSDADALEANQYKLNQHALDLAKTDQKNQLSAANQAISEAEAAYNSLQNQISDLGNRIVSLTSQMNDITPAEVKESDYMKNSETEGEEPVLDQKAYDAAVQAANAEAEKEREEIAAEISDLKEQLETANASVSSASTAITEAKNNYASVKSTTDEAIYSAQNTVDMQQYSSSDDNTTQTQLKELYEQLNDCEIVSQTEGIVTAVNIAEGGINTPNTTLITVESDDTLMLTASVDEKDILKLQEGMKATVTSDALGDQEIGGVITKVVRVFNGNVSAVPEEGGEVSAAPQTGGFSVQIALDDCELLSGMTAKAKIALTDQSNVLCVPYDLIQEDEDGSSFVLCAEENEDGSYTAVRKNITTGDEINYYTVITGGEVREGDYIIMDFSLSEGDTFQADVYSDEDSLDPEASDASEADS